MSLARPSSSLGFDVSIISDTAISLILKPQYKSHYLNNMHVEVTQA